MFHIIVKRDGVEQGRIALTEPSATVGRADSNQIVLAEDSVSRRHARFVLEDGKLFVEDLRSGNGTYVRGEQLNSRQELHNSDEVLITPFSMHVLVDEEDESTESQDMRTVMIPAMGNAGAPPAMMDPATTGARMLLRRGEADKSSYALDKAEFSIGRSEDRDIILTDPASSRKHATIKFQGDHYVIEDLGSANGIMVNNVSVRESALNPGDRLIIGETEFEFVWANAPARAPAAGADGYGAVPPPPGMSGEIDPYSETGIMPAYGNWPGQPGAMGGMNYGTELGGTPQAKGGKLRLIGVAAVVLIGALIGIKVMMDRGKQTQQPTHMVLRDPCEAYGDTCPDPTDQVCLNCLGKKARLARGQELFGQKEFGQAIAEFQRILQEIDPLDTKAIRFRYISYEFWALTVMEDALRERTQSATEKLNQMKADFEAAKAVYDRYARKYPSNTSQGTLSNARSQLNRAIRLFRAVEKMTLEEPEAEELRNKSTELSKKAIYYISRLAKVKEEKSREAFVASVQTTFEEAQALKASGVLAKAEVKFRQVIEKDPEKKTVYPDQARQEITAIKAKMKDRAKPLLNEAIRKMRNQQWAEARVKLKKALEIDPNLSEAKERLARVDAECLRRAKKLYSEAKVQYNVNQYAQAEKLLKQVLGFVPDQNEDLNQKARKMLRDMGRN